MKIVCPNPNCSQQIEVTPQQAGMQVSCPACTHVMQLPQLSEFGSSTGALQRQLAPQSQIGIQPTQSPQVNLGGGGGGSGMWLGITGCVLGGVALIHSLFFVDELPGKSLSAFNLKSPEAATRSILEIELGGNMLASAELALLGGASDREKKLKLAKESLDVNRTEEHGAYSLVFYSYKTLVDEGDGKEKEKLIHVAKWLEEEDGKYVPTFFPSGLKKDALEKIQKAISEWRAKTK